MKRIITILLFGLLLFNWIGYRFFISYMENASETRLTAQLDNNNYDETQLVSIKVPIRHLSYYNSSATFERAEGQIQFGGLIYKYVKRRIYNDSLEVLCIRDRAAMQLNTAKNEFFKLANDLQSDTQSKKSDSHKGFFKSFSGDNYAVDNLFVLSHFDFSMAKSFFGYSENLVSSYSTIHGQPPDLSFFI